MNKILEKLNERFLKDDLRSFDIKFTCIDEKIFFNYQDNQVQVLFGSSLSSEEELNRELEEWKLLFCKDNIKYNLNNDLIIFEDGFEIPVKLLKKRFKSNNEEELIYYTFENNETKIIINEGSKDFYTNFFNSEAYAFYWKLFFTDKHFKKFVQNSEIENKKVDIKYILRGTKAYSAKFIIRSGIFDVSSLSSNINLIKSCIYSLLVNKKVIININEKRYEEKIKNRLNNNDDISGNLDEIQFKIPKLIYDENLVSYYKAAYNSSLPSQKFLDFYHVFEYLFLSVSEFFIYDKVKTYINHPKFRSDEKDIEKIISLIKRNNTENDETEMLKKVLTKYIDEDDLIEYICERGYDKVIKDKMFFGEKFTLSPKSGHLISNISKILKHVRNALVHSSDRYKREDCHIPFSESENLVNILIPMMDFLAQKIIAGTAQKI